MTHSGLRRPLSALHGVGPRRAAALAAAGLHTIDDLLLRLPRRYEDRARLVPLASVRPGVVTVRGTVERATVRPTRRPRFSLFEVTVRDASGTARAVWFNQPFLAQTFTPGQEVVLHGTAELTGSGPQLSNPDFEHVSEAPGGNGDQVHMGRIVPVYERIGPLTPKMLRSLVHQALAALDGALPDPLPPAVCDARRLPGRLEALRAVHFPDADADIEALHTRRTPAHVRLILEEFFLLQLVVCEQRASRVEAVKPHRVTVTDQTRAAVRQLLPFPLTPGQKLALSEIVADLQRAAPMNRLLQGDVGSGKTLVAVVAAVVAMRCGLQVALMVPTELLAAQHTRTLAGLLASTPFGVALLTGSRSAADARRDRARVAAGEVQLVVGTHALVEGNVQFARLGLVIVDEQHRFGVQQRAALREKGLQPDVLVMTATPIPRTLALTALGDLDVSVIDDRPPGRPSIRTTVRPASRRVEVYAFVREQVEHGRQAYVVVPLVDPSDKVAARAAVTTAEELATGLLAGLRVGLLHGRLATADAAAVMEAFVSGALDVLVATTVVEVGVDVANATVMVIEHADRFGLAQLHQLRGRVGRGPHASFCALLYDAPLSPDGRARLEAMGETSDGFVIAERDLALRGPGDVLGTRQSGLPALRVGSLSDDGALLSEARALAQDWIARWPEDAPERVAAREAWSARFKLAQVG